VAGVQYTDTHKQYTEQHKTNSTYNNTKIRKSAGHVLLAFALQLRKNHGKISVRVAIHKHTIRIHRIRMSLVISEQTNKELNLI
jgi:hypothetical protein